MKTRSRDELVESLAQAHVRLLLVSYRRMSLNKFNRFINEFTQQMRKDNHKISTLDDQEFEDYKTILAASVFNKLVR